MSRRVKLPIKVIPPRRGFAARPPDERRDLARLGGLASATSPNHRNTWDRATAREMGRKGGRARAARQA